MNIAKNSKIVLVFAGIVVIIFSANLYGKYFSGIWPAILPPVTISPIVVPSGEPPQNTTGMPLVLPSSFSISIFAKDLVNPRVMAFDPDSNLLVSITGEGKVVALPDGNVDGISDKSSVVVSGLNRPHGLAFRCEGSPLRLGQIEASAGVQVCKLYIAESDQIAVYDYDREKLLATNKKKIADLPDGGAHFTRTIGFDPDGRLYVSIGSDCNVCNEADERRAKIFFMNADGSDFKEFARGLRNTVFFTWHPTMLDMWGADMGRDLLGDNQPPDEINIIEEGENYGWPNCYGKNIHDTIFDKNTYIRNPCMEPFEMPSYIDIPAHSAPLGLAFVPEDLMESDKPGAGKIWPEEYWYNLFVAYHGSWNRSTPTGYKIVRYKLDEEGNYLGIEDFITGWLKEGDGAYGRPTDIIVLPGGYMYISDDKAGVIYRVVFRG